MRTGLVVHQSVVLVDGYRLAVLEPRAIAAGSAAFLVDTYGLPLDHELVLVVRLMSINSSM